MMDYYAFLQHSKTLNVAALDICETISEKKNRKKDPSKKEDKAFCLCQKRKYLLSKD
jgi:hypothetical protein